VVVGKLILPRGAAIAVDPMPHRIFEIDEVLRVIVQYTRDTCEATTISLACCCKSFEEPTLSILWVSKHSKELVTFFPSILTCAPTEKEWKRFRRYASWIRVLSVNSMPQCATQELTLLLDLIASSSTNGPTQQATFPNLRDLTWCGEPSSLAYLPSFVSPILTDLHVYVAAQLDAEHLPGEYAPLELVINSTISPSNLQSLCLYIPPEPNPSPELRQGVADLILRCGSTLTTFGFEFELPESVVLHLMSLPNLETWRATQPAPTTPISSLLRPTPSFTQMISLTLRTGTPRSWLAFINTLAAEKPHPPPATHAPAFGNLICFDMNPPSGQLCLGSCAFPLTDSDISLLADALPRLQWAHLGTPCSFNTCQTTFRSLHTLSTRCPRLEHLCIHINMTTLVQDIRSVFEDGQQMETRGTRPGPSIGGRGCLLNLTFVYFLPLEANVGVGDLEVVVKGLVDISVAINVSPGPNTKLWAKVSEGVNVLHAQNSDTGCPASLN